MLWKVTSLDMFLKGIKPAILGDSVNDPKLYKLASVDNFFVTQLSNGFVLSHAPIRVANHCDLGVVLGYYPPSCMEFENKFNRYRSLGLDFNGISFSTLGFEYEAMLWCLERYGEASLKEFGVINTKFINVDRSWRVKTLSKYKLKTVGQLQELKCHLNSLILNGVKLVNY